MTRFEERVLTGKGAAIPDDRISDLVGRPTNGLVSPFDVNEGLGFILDDLVETLVAVFRLHPHIGNVMTHISGGQWGEVGRALRTILDPHSTHNELSPLAMNILELLWAERGITGRILKPYFRALLNKLLSPHVASRLSAHVSGLLLEMEAHRYASSGEGADDGPDDGAVTPDGGLQCARQPSTVSSDD